ncbi:MAG: SDR family oxidoreductase, partial [Gemmatimonadetes bacterium]|nr:SDR family oxidoreductase [Gemmatimonadota bacterium]
QHGEPGHRALPDGTRFADPQGEGGHPGCRRLVRRREADRYPLTRGPGSAEQVARVVLFLASDASDHLTGTEMWVDGGESLLAAT